MGGENLKIFFCSFIRFSLKQKKIIQSFPSRKRNIVSFTKNFKNFPSKSIFLLYPELWIPPEFLPYNCMGYGMQQFTTEQTKKLQTFLKNWKITGKAFGAFEALKEWQKIMKSLSFLSPFSTSKEFSFFMEKM